MTSVDARAARAGGAEYLAAVLREVVEGDWWSTRAGPSKNKGRARRERAEVAAARAAGWSGAVRWETLPNDHPTL